MSPSISQIFHDILFLDSTGRLLESSPPIDPDAPMGATLEVQRQMQVEELQQQMIFNSMHEMRNRGIPITRRRVSIPYM